jgi:hypothetical protein
MYSSKTICDAGRLIGAGVISAFHFSEVRVFDLFSHNQTKKINPAKLQTHLNIPEPHGYIKNAAWARNTRLYP